MVSFPTVSPPRSYTPPLLTHTPHIPSLSHSSRFYHPHNIGRGVKSRNKWHNTLKCTWAHLVRNRSFENGNLYITAQGARFRKLPKLYRGIILHVAFIEWPHEFVLSYVVWAGSPAGSHKKRTKLQAAGHDAATAWQWRTGGKLSLPQPAN